MERLPNGIIGQINQRSLKRFGEIKKKSKAEAEAEAEELKNAPGIYGFVRRKAQTFKKYLRPYAEYLAKHPVTSYFTRRSYKASRPSKQDRLDAIELLYKLNDAPPDVQTEVASFFDKVRDEDKMKELANIDDRRAFTNIAKIIERHIAVKPIDIVSLLTQLDEVIKNQLLHGELKYFDYRNNLNTILHEFVPIQWNQWPMELLYTNTRNNSVVAKYFDELYELRGTNYEFKIDTAYGSLVEFLADTPQLRRLFSAIYRRHNDYSLSYYTNPPYRFDYDNPNEEVSRYCLIVQILCFILLNVEDRKFILDKLAPPPPAFAFASAPPPAFAFASAAQSSTFSPGKTQSQSRRKKGQSHGKKVSFKNKR